MVKAILISFSILLTLLLAVSADNPQCGKQAGGALCPDDLCCSKDGFCGVTDPYCGEDCQSNCDGTVESLLPRELFEEMLSKRNDCSCQSSDIYTYDAFISAAKAFPEFAGYGHNETRKRELAAFFAQTSHQTTGAPPNAADPFEWGYCLVNESNPDSDYCDSTTYPCCPEKSYFGRGPIQLTWNSNYTEFGEHIGRDLFCHPELVATNPVISFKSAIWFWMTAPLLQKEKPSCHDAITGKWSPTEAELAAGWRAGYGMTTYIINSTECGSNGDPDRVKNRIGFFETYCGMIGVTHGDNLDCSDYTIPNPPNGNGLIMDLVESM